MQQVFFHFPGSPRNSYEIPDAPELLHPPQSVPVLPHAVLHYQLYVYSNPGLSMCLDCTRWYSNQRRCRSNTAPTVPGPPGSLWCVVLCRYRRAPQPASPGEPELLDRLPAVMCKLLPVLVNHLIRNLPDQDFRIAHAIGKHTVSIFYPNPGT